MSNPLRTLGPDLYCLDGEVPIPGAKLPARMTVMRLGDGSIALHSPLAMDDATADAVRALGPVRFIVAPSLMHHLYVGPAKARFTDAKVLGADGLAAKRKDLAFDGALPESGAPFGDESVLAQRIDGMPSINEVVFFHKASNAVVLTDLLFNVRESPYFGTRLLLRTVSGVYGRCALSRLVKWSVKDRALAAAGLRRVLAWKPERLVMAHGEPIDSGATEVLERELAWFFA